MQPLASACQVCSRAQPTSSKGQPPNSNVAIAVKGLPCSYQQVEGRGSALLRHCIGHTCPSLRIATSFGTYSAPSYPIPSSRSLMNYCPVVLFYSLMLRFLYSISCALVASLALTSQEIPHHQSSQLGSKHSGQAMIRDHGRNHHHNSPSQRNSNRGAVMSWDIQDINASHSKRKVL